MSMSMQESLVSATRAHVRSLMEQEGTGHDWWHVDRVRNTAVLIAREEDADVVIVELSALLHDIADWKFHNGDFEAGARVSRVWLESQQAEATVVDRVCDIVRHVSFKGAGVADEMSTIEGKCVQDADRLDAIGAIGIARAFAYGGHRGRPIYDPEQTAEFHATVEAYKKRSASTIHHFYEKLLLMKDRLHTSAGKRLAEQRHAYLEQFLEQFYAEWEGRR
ncbi:MAG: HD domain-containing protein [Patescibacteria group bacterium]